MASQASRLLCSSIYAPACDLEVSSLQRSSRSAAFPITTFKQYACPYLASMNRFHACDHGARFCSELAPSHTPQRLELCRHVGPAGCAHLSGALAHLPDDGLRGVRTGGLHNRVGRARGEQADRLLSLRVEHRGQLAGRAVPGVPGFTPQGRLVNSQDSSRLLCTAIAAVRSHSAQVLLGSMDAVQAHADRSPGILKHSAA